jgi:hypothetical protein
MFYFDTKLNHTATLTLKYNGKIYKLQINKLHALFVRYLFNRSLCSIPHKRQMVLGASTLDDPQGMLSNIDSIFFWGYLNKANLLVDVKYSHFVKHEAYRLNTGIVLNTNYTRGDLSRLFDALSFAIIEIILKDMNFIDKRVLYNNCFNRNPILQTNKLGIL